MERTLAELAQEVHGQLRGDGGKRIQGARSLLAAGPTDIAFLDGKQHTRELEACRAGALLAPPGVSHNGTPIIEVADPLAAFTSIYLKFHPQPAAPPPGIDPRAAIDPSARLGTGCTVHPFVTIGAGTVLGQRCRLHPGVTIGQNCVLGDDVVLHPNVVIYDGCTLGSRVILHAGVVIGADGFGYRLEQGRHAKIPQYGGVVIEDDVEVGANSTIDRGTFEPTRVATGTKIDNLVMVGHNCRIGRHNLLVSQVGIAGSSSTGDYVVMAGQVGVADHVHIGDRAMLGAQSGVHKDIPADTKVLGAPARPVKEAQVILLSMDKLPELRKDVKEIKKHLKIAG